MSELSYLEKLLDGVEVEWKTLGTVIKTVTASSKLKSQAYRASGKLPIVDQGIKFIAGYTDEDVTPIEAGKYIIFGDHSEHIKYVDFPFVQGADGLKILSPISANAKYIYHAFLKFYKKELSYKRHWSTAQQTLIPIPCPDNPEKSLAIQSEIVRILDKFTALTAELTAELNMRKKQYNYYRDQLLSFEDGEVEWKALGTICQIGDGNHSSKYPKANEMIEQGIPFIRGTNMVNGTICNQDMKYISKEKHNELKKGHLKAFDVLIANRGEVGKVAYVPEGYSGSNLNSQLAWLRANPEIIINRYLFFILCSSTIQNKLSGEGGALQQLTIKNIKNIQIPVPSITVQSNIVSFLDKFDSLTNSISEGLPREIELRQKQYEYYRDLLFSFPKPDTVSN
ncbi:restriction endonuclease subunit S [Escherichia coli]|uniref:restriction endonuclease subunit S n=1 Tax=Escherichia coli TaxID=562 RepID=UPI001582E6F7|nr:restriction endonuclease subunit S [Escherichia coli]EJA1145445.1 restriction endonuclease subunit S [Escherichia coli]EKR4915892.1 restriction endonuclease subunit S [Escherichia coli]MBE1835207.1 restriction endonuclease subunit S [Escherichia coli]MBE3326612.1 restriction endonuclease subunit S [Escherichia coli]BEA90229.1 hypothetical protein VEE03_48120 [Escherichia coli]